MTMAMRTGLAHCLVAGLVVIEGNCSLEVTKVYLELVHHLLFELALIFQTIVLAEVHYTGHHKNSDCL